MKREKVFVIQPGSHTLKVGLSHLHMPYEIPNLISYRGNPLDVDPAIHSKISENEICYLRRKLLEERNLLKPLPNSKSISPLTIKTFMESDEDLYFEEIAVKQDKVFINSAPQEGENVDYIVGGSSREYSKTFFPISQGFLNYESYGYSTQRIKDDFYRIWSHCFLKCLNMKTMDTLDLSEYAAVLVVGDSIQSEDLTVMLEVIFDYFGFERCFVHQESVCSTFGIGIGSTSGVCVIDCGHTKTSILCVNNGMINPKTRICLPFGGFDVTKSLVNIMHHCEFPLNSMFEFQAKSAPSDDNIASHEGNDDVFNILHNHQHLNIFNTLKENHCFYPASLSQKELFQHLRISHHTGEYSFHVGDPLLIPVMGYFNPLLFFPYGNAMAHARRYLEGKNFPDGRRSIVDNSKIYSQKYLDYMKDVYGNGVYKSFQEYLDLKEEVDEEDGEEEEEEEEDILKKNEELMTLHEAVIKSIEASDMSLRRKRKRKKGTNDIDLDLLIVGGGSYLRGVVPKLQYLLMDYFSKKFGGPSTSSSSSHIPVQQQQQKGNKKQKEDKSSVKVHINIFPGSEANVDLRYVAWKGAALTPTFRTVKKLWIEKEDFQNFGMKAVKKAIPFNLE